MKILQLTNNESTYRIRNVGFAGSQVREENDQGLAALCRETSKLENV